MRAFFNLEQALVPPYEQQSTREKEREKKERGDRFMVL
jgi:hypothetical protein